jgi:hypothetical protein
MRIKWFAKFAKKEGIGGDALVQAATAADTGKIDADLGGGVIKQRIARPGEGKSGGYRTIILYRKGDKAFFVFGFAKNELDNISRDDLRAFKKLAKVMLSLSDTDLLILLKRKELEEVK